MPDAAVVVILAASCFLVGWVLWDVVDVIRDGRRGRKG